MMRPGSELVRERVAAMLWYVGVVGKVRGRKLAADDALT